MTHRLTSVEFWIEGRGKWLGFGLVLGIYALIPRTAQVEIVNETVESAGFVVLDDGSFPGRDQSFGSAVSLRADRESSYRFILAPAGPEVGRVRIRSKWKDVLSGGSITSYAAGVRFFEITSRRHRSIGTSKLSFDPLLESGGMSRPTHLHVGDGRACTDARIIDLALEGKVDDARRECLDSLGTAP